MSRGFYSVQVPAGSSKCLSAQDVSDSKSP